MDRADLISVMYFVVCTRICRRILLATFKDRIDDKVDCYRHNDDSHDLPQRNTVIRVDVTFMRETRGGDGERRYRKPNLAVFVFHLSCV